MWQFVQQYLAEPFTSQNCKCEHSTISSLATSDSTPASIDGVWLYCGSTIILLDKTPAIYVYDSIQYSTV